MTKRDLLTIVLAAGKGTRMKSAMPKVLHQVAGRSMLGHVLALAQGARAGRLAVVIGPGMDDVRAAVMKLAPSASVFVQDQQRGTADAVLAAREAIAAHRGDVIVLYADTPLIEAGTIDRLLEALDAGAGIAVLGFEARDATGYGRLITGSDGRLEAIREEKDASEAERALRLCNSGVMAFRSEGLLERLGRIGCANAKGEYYLTDLVELSRADGLAATAVSCAEDEVLGVNARDQLAVAEGIFLAEHRSRVIDRRFGFVKAVGGFVGADDFIENAHRKIAFVIGRQRVAVDTGDNERLLIRGGGFVRGVLFVEHIAERNLQICRRRLVFFGELGDRVVDEFRRVGAVSGACLNFSKQHHQRDVVRIGVNRLLKGLDGACRRIGVGFFERPAEQCDRLRVFRIVGNRLIEDFDRFRDATGIIQRFAELDGRRFGR